MKDFDINLKLDRVSVLEGVLLNSKHEDERLEAINQLKSIRDIRAQLALAKVLSDSSGKIRESSINSIKISEIPDDVIVPHLRRLINDQNASIRERALQLLKEIGREDFLPLFLDKLSDESDLVRNVAVQAIGEISNDKTLDTLIKQFQANVSPLIKCSILQNLSNFKSEKVKNFLASVLMNENESDEVRAEAALSLAKSTNLEAFPLILKMLNSNPSIQLKIGLIQSLAFINDEKVIEFLIELFEDEYQRKNYKTLIIPPHRIHYMDLHFDDLDDSSKILVSIFKILGDLHNDIAIPFLLKMLNNVYHLIRIFSIAALSQFDDPIIDERFKSILNDQNENPWFKAFMRSLLYIINEKKAKDLGISDYITCLIEARVIKDYFLK